MTMPRLRAALAGAALLAGALVLAPPGAVGAPAPDDTEWLPESYRTPSALATDVTPQAVVCDGDGVSGRRVQTLYVRGDGQPDRYDQFVGTFQNFADRIDDAFVEAAGRLGGGARHVRYVHDSACRAVVDNVTVPQSAMGSVDSITDAIQARGYDRADRKYLVWYDAGGCGLAFGNGGNDSPGASNPYNGGPHYAMLGTGCWSWQASAHELLHTIGAVQSSAPNATRFGHCWDDEDIMCYDDGGIPNPPGSLQPVCPGAPENQLDCNGDDYFHTDPPAGSYLATHWNVANSLYLIRGGAAGPTGAITGVGGKCVDVASSDTADGTAIQLWTCNGTGAQRWTVRGDTLRALGKCMDVTFSGTANGTPIQLWECNGTGAQVWQQESGGVLRNPRSGRCLDATGGSSADGTRLVVRDCAASASQRWQLPG